MGVRVRANVRVRFRDRFRDRVGVTLAFLPCDVDVLCCVVLVIYFYF